uniref:LAGLIDADG endonuclease n=1 Tax=Orbilia oligospora TaxID=2813651 RepID=A0A6H2U2L9_ORBOL|nr:LAGLIDADG endonuclease [Orbilia oligospora]QID02832.1 hypothetical protein [Orbilia oligospora]QID02874.1 hypothetical protein [Orbilia oligospora]
MIYYYFIVPALAIKLECPNKLYKNSINFKQLNRMLISTTAFKLSPNSKKSGNSNVSSVDIVLWGSNLGLTLGGRLTRIQSSMTKIPLNIQSIIIGLILSDGWMQLPFDSKNARLCFKQSTKNSPYVWFVFFLLSHYCSSFPHVTTGIRKGKPFSGLAFQTRQLPCLTDIYNLFYINKIKIVPSNIYELLTPVALAHWIMGDGSAVNKGLVLCTDYFSLEQTTLLLNVLVIKYKLDCTLWKQSSGWRIYISRRSMPNLRSIVINHMHPSMLYKL